METLWEEVWWHDMALIVYNHQDCHRQHELASVSSSCSLWNCWQCPSHCGWSLLPSVLFVFHFLCQIESWHVNALDAFEREMRILKFATCCVTLYFLQ